MPKYRYLLQDIRTRAFLAEPKIGDVKYSDLLNRPGSFSGTVDYGQFGKRVVLNKSMFQPAKTALHVERAGKIVWSGPIWTRRIGDSGLEVGAEGWHSYLRRRTINWNLDYNQQDKLYIARDLVDRAMAVSGGDVNIVTGSETSGVLSDRTYKAHERKDIGTALEQLAATQNGFDFEYRPRWDGSGDVVVDFIPYHPTKGRTRHDLHFVHGANIIVLTEESNGKKTANTIHMLGAGEGEDMVRTTVSSPEYLDDYPLLEDTLARKSVRRQETLVEHGQNRLAATQEAPEIISAEVKTTPGTFDTGDSIRVFADDGPHELDEIHRVVGRTVAVSNEGDEKTTVQFAPLEAFSV